MVIPNDTQQWLAPYGYAFVGIIIISAIAHLVLRFLQNKYDFLWYRQAVSWRKLSLSRKRTLEKFSFYNQLSSRYKKQFEHRVVCFIADKSFKHRYDKQITDEQKVTLSSVAIMLTFGRRNYIMDRLDTILLFDEPFESAANGNKHKGEYNPRARVLALSWPDVVDGISLTNDNFHLALHEFTHVIHIESERDQHMDAIRYHKYHQKLLLQLADKELREKLEDSRFLRTYAFSNQYEFMAVLTEYFFESPAELNSLFPSLYQHLKTALLLNDEWIS